MDRARRSITAGFAGATECLTSRFQELAAAGGPAAELVLDSSPPKPGGSGVHVQAIGRSRGGRTTKLHALVDGQGRPVAFVITPGQCSDAPVAVGLLS